MQYGFYHDNDVCIGCNCCVIACKDKNDLPVGEKYRRVYDYAGCEWSVDEAGITAPSHYFAYSVSVACMHCANPACLSSCPASAIEKREDGIVFRDEEICIGCGTCARVCPYEAPYVSKITSKSRKCDFCKDYIDMGEVPACVGACPTRCLHYGDIDELRAKHGGVLQVEPIAADTGTEPSIVFNRMRLNAQGTLPGEVVNAPEELVSETLLR